MRNILKNLCPQIYLHQGSHNCPLYTFRASWAIVMHSDCAQLFPSIKGNLSIAQTYQKQTVLVTYARFGFISAVL